MDQRHSLGGVQAGELYRYKAIQLLEALVAADLLPITGFGYLLYHRFEDCFVYRRSFVLVPVCTPRLVDVPGRPDLTSSKSAEHILRREPLDLHPSLQSLAGVVEELVERVAVRIHAVGYSLQGHAAERGKQRKALPLRQILVDKAPEIREDYALRCRQLGVRYRVCRRDGVLTLAVDHFFQRDVAPPAASHLGERRAHADLLRPDREAALPLKESRLSRIFNSASCAKSSTEGSTPPTRPCKAALRPRTSRPRRSASAASFSGPRKAASRSSLLRSCIGNHHCSTCRPTGVQLYRRRTPQSRPNVLLRGRGKSLARRGLCISERASEVTTTRP